MSQETQNSGITHKNNSYPSTPLHPFAESKTDIPKSFCGIAAYIKSKQTPEEQHKSEIFADALNLWEGELKISWDK